MVWGAFSRAGKLELQFVSSKMKSADDITILEKSLKPFLAHFEDENWTFQQDNARIHTSSETSAWFRAENITVLDWPACSPDLNPMENLWPIMVRRVYAENKHYDTVEQLKEAIESAWLGVESHILGNFIESMKRRVFQLIGRSGRLTNY